MQFPALAAFIAFGAQLANGKLYDSIDSLPNRIYDFIVVGGGTAGSVIASRLTENSRFTVLVVEAGPNNEGVLDLQVPAFVNNMPSTYDWGYVTVPQTGVNNRTIPFPRGHVLGGSSSVNGMVYTRGSADDYDAWAKITGDAGWSWKNLIPYAKKHERWTPPVGNRNITGEYDPKVHGYNGRTLVSLRQSPPEPFDLRALQTTKDMPEVFSFSLDPNSGYPIGLSWTQSTIGNGERSSAATAFLDTPVRSRPNLDILINTQATRVLRTESGKQLEIRTVELAPRSGGDMRKILTAKKELILSAGAINTPQLLMLSGIGDRNVLATVGIDMVLDLPDVGKNMPDHSVNPVAFWNTNEQPLPQPDPSAALEEWKNSRSGPLTELARMQIIWARIPDNSTIWAHNSDPSSGKNAPHLELYLLNTGDRVGAAVGLLTPKSRGSVSLRSSNPFDAPVIDLGYLTHPFDMEAIREGARILERFFDGPAWADIVVSRASPDPDSPAFDAVVRTAISTTSHPVGTAAMSKRGAKTGVLDPDLRAKGVKGLRVVDASAFPLIPTGHTQAPTYILAERAADLIKAAWQMTTQ